MDREHSAGTDAAVPAGVGRRTLLVGALTIPVTAVAACGGGGGNQPGGNGTTGGATTTTAPGGQTTAPTKPTKPGGSGGSTVVQPPITVRGQEVNYHGEKSVIGEDSVRVDLYDFYFEPTVLVGSPGQEITVYLFNEGEVPHTFTIREQNIDVVLDPGQKGQTKLMFPKSGQQGFVCRFHIPQGMLGLLVTKS